MTNINVAARIVMVVGCPRPRIALPKEVESMMDTVFFCFVHLFPTGGVAHDYRAKETTVVTFLQEKFSNVDWRWTRR
ncbi:MAG: hypothetical protein GY775_16015 [Candidatus Scalindua sp.]|nr:hypothetical protein [Candidatus Scalindua sp.]